MLTNFHTHCSFSDGKQDPETIVREAIRKGLTGIGFSTHAPVHFENTWAMQPGRLSQYMETISGLKRKYAGHIEIYLGMEIDYFIDVDEALFRNTQLDYIIGSVHFLTNKGHSPYYPVDMNPDKFTNGIDEMFGGDAGAYVKTYYSHVRDLIIRYRPSVTGHFDLVKKFNRDNRFFNEREKWYEDAVMPALLEIAKCGSIVEINTSIVYRGLGDEPYPSGWILKRCRDLGIPIMINSDAHSMDKLDAWFLQAREFARKAGFSSRRILSKGKWDDIPL